MLDMEHRSYLGFESHVMWAQGMWSWGMKLCMGMHYPLRNKGLCNIVRQGMLPENRRGRMADGLCVYLSMLLNWFLFPNKVYLFIQDENVTVYFS